MSWRVLTRVALAVSMLALTAGQAQAATPGPVLLQGNHLVDGSGNTIRLLGVNRSGTEYACSEGWGFTDSPDVNQPDSPALIAGIVSWHANAVRVPLNEACWLGINGGRRGGRGRGGR